MKQRDVLELSSNHHSAFRSVGNEQASLFTSKLPVVETDHLVLGRNRARRECQQEA